MDKSVLTNFAKTFIAGEWKYFHKENTIKKQFATHVELFQNNLIDENGYLLPELKAIIQGILGEQVLQNVLGPFGDEDIFSGEIMDDVTYYNIELHHISKNNIDALATLCGVSIKNIADDSI